MSVKSTSRDPVFRTWNIAILTAAVVLIALFTVELSAQSNPAASSAPQVTALLESGTGVIATDGRRLNARSGPGTTFAIVGKIEPETTVEILEASDDGLWLQIGTENLPATVWVAAEYVTSPAGTNSTSNTTPSTSSNTTTTTTTTVRSTTPAVVTSILQPRSQTPSTTALIESDDAEATEEPEAVTEPATETATEAAPLLSLLPTVTPTPVIDPAPNATGEPPASRLAVRVAPLNLGALVARSAETNTDSSETAPATAASSNTGNNPPALTLSPTATPLPTATPAPTPSVPTALTQPPRMNVRGGPGTSFEVVGSVDAGTALEILAANPAGDWYQVRLGQGGEPGWVFASLTQALGPVDTITRLSEEELPQPPAPPEPVAVSAQSPAPADTPSDAATGTIPVSAAPVSAPVAAPAPSGGAPFGYGVQAHMLGGGGDRSLEAVNDLGFNWIKQQVQWKLFEPSPGGRNFGELQGIVNAAGGRGINVLFSVVDAPPWAREPGFDGSVGGPPADPQTYAAFVGAMAGTFCGTSLKAIEVWNEQNLHYEWGNKPLSPVEYMNLLRPAYAAIKAACPSMYVISGSPTPAGNNPPFAMDDFQYLEAMYQNGLANYADGIGAHPSGYNLPPSVTWQDGCAAIQVHGNSFNGACDSPHHSWSFRSTMEGYRNIMVTYGDANKKVWPTEFGWAAGGAFDPRYAYANDNSFEEQAAWTVESYQMMKAWGWVGPAILWNLNFRVVADGTEKAQWGIVSNDWQPLPIYHALRAMPK